jgi:hypothetical protein
MTILKPAAESKFSVCCVWAQPATRAIKAKAEARLNPLKICFTAFLFSWLIAWSQFDGPLFDIAGANQRVKEFSTFERLLILGESRHDPPVQASSDEWHAELLPRIFGLAAFM